MFLQVCTSGKNKHLVGEVWIVDRVLRVGVVYRTGVGVGKDRVG